MKKMKNHILIRNTETEDLLEIMSLEKKNSDFVSCCTLDQHLRILEDIDNAHMCITSGEDRIVGFFILMGCKSPDHVLEFRRIAIGEKGKGYGRTALKYIKDFCFNELGFHRLWLDVFDDNKRAIALYESEGFIQEALLRENVATKGGYRSQRIYSMLEEEYRKLSNP